jgi:hypothetical protein
MSSGTDPCMPYAHCLCLYEFTWASVLVNQEDLVSSVFFILVVSLCLAYSSVGFHETWGGGGEETHGDIQFSIEYSKVS